MCFHSKQSKSAQELEHRFKAKMLQPQAYKPAIYNGFQFPQMPVVANAQPEAIQLFQWGLIPPWAKDDSIRKNTLNARSETLLEKPSFRSVIHQRCLVLSDGFFEWQWLDDKGKQKKKFLLSLSNEEAFAFAGLWSEWVDTSTGEIIPTFTILTTAANPLMAAIHNTKQRMPVILAPEHEQSWLNGQPFQLQNDRLQATEL
ncbi:MAG: Protein of unknown function YoqW [Bacteroidota bacterium]|jgi:putative SOS response-associated peptidase YedK